jgi:xylulokinase
MAAGPATYLGLDVGTQGVKALLAGEDGVVLARASRGYGLIAGLPPGAAEQHPETWVEAAGAAARELWATPGVFSRAPAGIGVSGQQHGLVVLDEAERVVRPAKLWCDTSTAEEARELSRALGRAVPTGFTASKILWLARHEPASWARAARVLLPHDFLNLRLSCRATMEAGDASGTGFFDLVERRFDAGAMARIDPRLESMMPQLVAAGEPAGMLTREGAALLGLGEETVGTPVASGGGDNMMSAIGSGATRPGVAVVSLGTSGTVFTYSAEPLVDPAGLIAPFCDSTGGWLPLLCVMNATGVLEEVRAAFGAEHGELEREAAAVEPGADGLLLLPFLAGERVPDLPHASGVLTGIRPGLLGRAHLYRAALEGVSLNLAWGVERMRALGLEIQSVRVVGGGARNALWRSVLADALGASVVRLAEDESAAFGAALQARWTALRLAGERVSADDVASSWVRTAGETMEPDPARVALYAEALKRFRDWTRAAFPQA